MLGGLKTEAAFRAASARDVAKFEAVTYDAEAQAQSPNSLRNVERSSGTALSSARNGDAVSLAMDAPACPSPNRTDGTANGAVVGTMQSTTSSNATIFASIERSAYYRTALNQWESTQERVRTSLSVG